MLRAAQRRLEQATNSAETARFQPQGGGGGSGGRGGERRGGDGYGGYEQGYGQPSPSPYRYPAADRHEWPSSSSAARSPSASASAASRWDARDEGKVSDDERTTAIWEDSFEQRAAARTEEQIADLLMEQHLEDEQRGDLEGMGGHSYRVGSARSPGSRSGRGYATEGELKQAGGGGGGGGAAGSPVLTL